MTFEDKIKYDRAEACARILAHLRILATAGIFQPPLSKHNVFRANWLQGMLTKQQYATFDPGYFRQELKEFPKDILELASSSR